MGRIISARFGGVCAVCDQRWAKGDPISPFGDASSHVDRWGHPACVAADAMGYPSAETAKERIAAVRAGLQDVRKAPLGDPPPATRAPT